MPEHSILERLAVLDPATREHVLRDVPIESIAEMAYSWRWTARPSQLAPAGTWSQWIIMAGRGFGKTRAGAEWVTELARESTDARFALVGVSTHDGTSVMVEGESGLLAVAGADFEPEWLPSRRLLVWPNGAQASVLSASEPNQLRGPQFHYAWCDELAAWPKPREAWDNLRMGLRLGRHPRAVVTTTPRALPLLRTLLDAPGTVVSYIAPGLLRLSGLLRGRFGTPAAAAGANALVMSILPGSGTWLALSPEMRGRTLRIQVDGAGDQPGGASLAYVVQGAARTPLAPAHVRGKRLRDGTIVCSWITRDRVGWGFADGLPDVSAPIVGSYKWHFRANGNVAWSQFATSSGVWLDVATQAAALGGPFPPGVFQVEAVGDGPESLRFSRWVALKEQ